MKILNPGLLYWKAEVFCPNAECKALLEIDSNDVGLTTQAPFGDRLETRCPVCSHIINLNGIDMPDWVRYKALHRQRCGDCV